MKKRIVFVGGDKRQFYAARKLGEEDFDVFVSGFEKLNQNDVNELENFYSAGVIVLPVTGLKGGVVPAYYSDKEIKIDNKKLTGKLVIMGKRGTLGGAKCEVCDLLSSESFAVYNALPSAEGAVQAAMENYDGTISGANCLVIGYGRIGKVLSRILSALNAEVTVASRGSVKHAEIKLDGNTPLKTAEIKSLNGYDIVFNTADAPVIDSDALYNSNNSPLIIDLASKGGTDFETAKALGFNAIHALGLPGKCSPKAAGEIISDAVRLILREE